MPVFCILCELHVGTWIVRLCIHTHVRCASIDCFQNAQSDLYTRYDWRLWGSNTSPPSFLTSSVALWNDCKHISFSLLLKTQSWSPHFLTSPSSWWHLSFCSKHFSSFFLVYVCFCFPGGGSLFAIHGDCEAYDTRTDRWHMVASMSTRRARVGVAAIGNRLYAVGGWVIIIAEFDPKQLFVTQTLHRVIWGEALASRICG